MHWRRWWRAGARRRAALCALAAAALWAACGARVRVQVRVRARAPAAPAALAHLLADFSAYARLQPLVGAWRVLEEGGNYTAWRYRVQYACGPRCAARARVLALDEHARAHAPAHGRARAHRVLQQHRACRTLPLLPRGWGPELCDEWEAETEVRAGEEGAGGAELHETAARWCGAARALSGACARELLAERTALHAALRAELQARSEQIASAR